MLYSPQVWISAFLVIASYTLNLVLFLLPGLAVALVLSARRTLAPLYLVIIVVSTGALLGYLSFWCYFANKQFGKFSAYALYLTALVLTAWFLLRSPRARSAAARIRTPFLFVLLAGICYLSGLYLFADFQKVGPDPAEFRFFDQLRPGDDLIPYILADKISNHSSLHPFCCGWLSSDRPPLQAGIFLLVRPLRVGHSSVAQYFHLGTALQCLWIAGVWCVLTAVGVSKMRIRQILVLLILSGFLFFNSVFVWPKLLAATLLLFVVSILLSALRNHSPIPAGGTVLAAVNLGLALLAHPGSIFSLAAFSLLLIKWPKLLSMRRALLGVALLALLLPWIAYQKFVDPPGNRLLKMHLAGVTSIDNRGVTQTLIDEYRKKTPSKVLRLKLSNLQTLVGPKPLDSFGLTALRFNPTLHLDRAQTESSRVAQREYIWNAVGLLNLGWIAVIVGLIGSRKRQPVVPFSTWLIAAALFNLIIWSLTFIWSGRNLYNA